jgi:predicted XRE-type DNA-binding protein
MTNENPHIGSTLESFLQEEGIAEEVNAAAIKRVLAWQIEEAMKQQGISKNQMAKRMHTSRAYLDRFLDPNNNKVQLDTMQRAAAAIGRRLRLDLA